MQSRVSMLIGLAKHDVRDRDPKSQVSITVSHAWNAIFLRRQRQFNKFFLQRHRNIPVTVENPPVGRLPEKKCVTAGAHGSLPDLMRMHFSRSHPLIRGRVFPQPGQHRAP